MLRFRPVQARWFETYLPHEQTVRGIEIIAQSGVVELETDPRLSEPMDTHRLHYFVQRARTLIDSHRDDLPGGRHRPTALLGNPVHLANQALHRMRLWSARVDFLKEQLAEQQAERKELRLLGEALWAMRRDGIELRELFSETRFLCKCLFVCPKTSCPEGDEVAGQTALIVRGPRHDFLFMLGLRDQRAVISHLVVEQGCEQVGVPSWLSGDPAQRVRQIRDHASALEREITRLEAELRALRHDPEIAEARANLETLAWYLDTASRYLDGLELCHVTGWTTADDPERLQRELWESGIEAVVRYPDPPPMTAPPVTTLQSGWAQPFRPLLLLWGTPGRQEIDPSGLLALIVPLLFGYMFPDVGHGLLLTGFAVLFWRRWPDIRFLLPCGLAAMVFGLLFGEVFGFSEWLPALWVRPFDDPLLILIVPMVFGVGLLLLGLIFSGVEAKWSGTLGHWLAVDAAVLVLYLSLLAALFDTRALTVAGLALVHYVVGSLWQGRGKGLWVLAGAGGRLLFSLFELMLNTISFARVGAFALAHAAFSHTIITLADGVEQPVGWLLIIVLGNFFEIVIEGLVVFVQTTRLVLFEFFGHFLQAKGRLFRPVPRPVTSAETVRPPPGHG